MSAITYVPIDLLMKHVDEPDFLVIEKRKSPKETPVDYLSVAFKIKGTVYPAYFKLNDDIVVKSINLAAKEIKNEKDKKKFALSARKNGSGELGNFLEKVSSIVAAKIKVMLENKEIVPKNKNSNFSSHYKATYSDDSKIVEKRGMPLENPVIAVKFNFEKFSPKHPIASLRDKTMIEFQDWESRHRVQKGEKSTVEFKPFKIDGEIITENNVMELTSKTVTIMKGSCFSMNSISISIFGIAHGLELYKAIVKVEDTDEDDMFATDYGNDDKLNNVIIAPKEKEEIATEDDTSSESSDESEEEEVPPPKSTKKPLKK